jgi:hypothetical protein
MRRKNDFLTYFMDVDDDERPRRATRSSTRASSSGRARGRREMEFEREELERQEREMDKRELDEREIEEIQMRQMKKYPEAWTEKCLDAAKGWVLFSLRSTLERGDVREAILRKLLDRSVYIVGDPLSPERNYSELTPILKSFVNDIENPIIVFSAANLRDPETKETHYQSFILNKRERTLTCIDPAATSSGDGIYTPYVAQRISKFLASKKYTTIIPPVGFACQSSPTDIFCQTWSVILLHHFLNSHSPFFPRGGRAPNDREKGEILLKFYRDNLEIICEKLHEEYRANLRSDIFPGTSFFRGCLLEYDPCELFDELTDDFVMMP